MLKKNRGGGIRLQNQSTDSLREFHKDRQEIDSIPIIRIYTTFGIIGKTSVREFLKNCAF